MQQEKEKEVAAMKRRHKHAQEVRKQVKVKEDEKISACRAFFEEGIKLDHEAKERLVMKKIVLHTVMCCMCAISTHCPVTAVFTVLSDHTHTQ